MILILLFASSIIHRQNQSMNHMTSSTIVGPFTIFPNGFLWFPKRVFFSDGFHHVLRSNYRQVEDLPGLVPLLGLDKWTSEATGERDPTTMF